MKFEVLIQPRAARDIDGATAWIRERSPAAARRWYSGLIEAIESLSESPARCPLAPESDYFDLEIRQLLYGRKGRAYRVLFTISADQVHVLHFRHWARRHLNPAELRGPE